MNEYVKLYQDWYKQELNLLELSENETQAGVKTTIENLMDNFTTLNLTPDICNQIVTIIQRLINRKPLSPITEDDEFVKVDVDKNNNIIYCAKRYPPLLKQIINGVNIYYTYDDIEVSKDGGLTFGPNIYGFVKNVQLPYYPSEPEKRYVLQMPYDDFKDITDDEVEIKKVRADEIAKMEYYKTYKEHEKTGWL